MKKIINRKNTLIYFSVIALVILIISAIFFCARYIGQKGNESNAFQIFSSYIAGGGAYYLIF